MQCENSESDIDGCSGVVQTMKTTKKRMQICCMTDVSKYLSLQSHTPGQNCKHKTLKCFETVPESARNNILCDFDMLPSVHEQNSYLCSLIIIQKIQNRQPRLEDDKAKFRAVSYLYRV